MAENIEISEKKKIDNPRVFISYAWGTKQYQEKVLSFAAQLVDDGIDVVIDKWDLTEGNETYERYNNVEMIVPKSFGGDTESLKTLSPSEIKAALNKNFYWASTIKTPFLNKTQSEILIKALEEKYN